MTSKKDKYYDNVTKGTDKSTEKIIRNRAA